MIHLIKLQFANSLSHQRVIIKLRQHHSSFVIRYKTWYKIYFYITVFCIKHNLKLSLVIVKLLLLYEDRVLLTCSFSVLMSSRWFIVALTK
jgi:hypothetical protein